MRWGKGGGIIGGWGTICLALGVAFYVFEYFVRIGATQMKLGGREVLKIVGVYTGVQLGMLLLGFGAVLLVRLSGVEDAKTREWFYILTVVALLCYALSCLRTAYRGENFEERREREPTALEVARAAVKAGFMTVVVGMAAWYVSGQVLWKTVTICIFVFLAALAGLIYGYWYGTKWRRQISLAGGILLAVICAGLIFSPL